jgi:hypothetical protein
MGRQTKKCMKREYDNRKWRRDTVPDWYQCENKFKRIYVIQHTVFADRL